MKKKFFLLIGILLFLSCNEEKDGIIISDNIRTELDIVKIKETIFTQGDITQYKISIFSNKKKRIDSIYNENYELLTYTKWNYNNASLLVSTETFDVTNTLIPEQSIYLTYDNQQRIDTIKKVNYTLSFNYNTSNLIIKTSSAISNNDTVFIDTQKRVLKKSNGIERTEFFFDGNNLTSLKTTNIASGIIISSITYNYNRAITPIGYLESDIQQKTFFTKENAFLYFSISEASKIYSSLYPAFINKNGETTEISYITDNYNYLKESNTSVNGDFKSKKEYFFE